MNTSIHIFHTSSSSSSSTSVEIQEKPAKNKREIEPRMDRYFKLRQTFCDFLDTREDDSLKTPPVPISYPAISGMTEDDKKRYTVRKITEEEAESFNFPAGNWSPVYFMEPEFELRWCNKPDALCGRFQKDCEAEAMSKMAQRLLTLFLKMEMLESVAFKYDDIRAIRVFFMDDREMATDRLLAILDNIFSSSMIKLGQFSDKISVAVDYELRAFMSDQKKAKRLVFETMLKYPEFVPDSWGGEAAILKWKEMKEADVRRREADAKEMAENEKKEKEEKFKKDKAIEDEKTKNEEEKAKKEKERLEKEERIKKEVEEAERKKKEEKENRRKEVKKNRKERENAGDLTKKEGKKEQEEKTAFEKGFKEVFGGKKKKEKDDKKKNKKGKGKTLEATKTKDASHEEALAPPPPNAPHSPQTPPIVPSQAAPPSAPTQAPPPPRPSSQPREPSANRNPRLPHQTPPRKFPSVVGGVSNFLSGRKRRESSAEKVGGAPVEQNTKEKKGGAKEKADGGGLFGRKNHNNKK
ncbi:hypothetical protein L5515_005559 [Caenorhabditis briggsae]|uniref:DUF7774 domain-containing protein n=2 Tax=Caenorhabditis briggsae TaxID=6238 RepID=A0AAE9JF55_CAEBR|nr:hypothetical protein L5515_005559 [Caenorhabditis briggsae]